MVNLVADNICFNNIKLVVFDKDGTLFDLHKYWSFVIKQRALYFSDKYDCSSDKVYDVLTKNMGLVNENYISKKGPIGIKSRAFIINKVHKTLKNQVDNLSLNEVKDGFNKVDKIIDQELSNLVEKLPGVDYLISSLKNSGCFIALATTDIKQRTIKTLRHMKMESNFDYIVASDEVHESKPDREMIDTIISKYTGISCSQVVLIGDSMADLKMAKNSEIHFIGVKTGTNANEFISSGEPMVNYLTDIKLTA